MKDRIIKTDVDSALRSLEHSAVASAVVCERAAACGIEHGKFVPGYIAVERVYKECLDADKGLVGDFRPRLAHGFGFRYGVLVRFPSRGDAGEVRGERFHERASRRL